MGKIETKNIDRLILNRFDPSEKKDIMEYFDTGKWYYW